MSQPPFEPVERDCICLKRNKDDSHTRACNNKFRQKYLAMWKAAAVAEYNERFNPIPGQMTIDDLLT